MKTIKIKYWSDKPDDYTGIVEYSSGTKEWFLNGKKHRENGPAVELYTGGKHWFLNGEYHRENGPAIEYASGHKAWYLNGKHYTENEYKTEMMKRSSTLGKLLMKRTQL